jgi:GntR family transcriptional regulator/MocR family aminotransferase
MEDRKYEVLYETLRKQIVSGIYPYGTKLKSKRALAEEYHMSLITVEHALSLLSEEGYIETKERKASRVIYRAGDFMMPEDKERAEEKAGAFVHTESLFPFSVLARTMRHVLSIHGEEILARKEIWGCQELRLALSRYLGRSRGIAVSPDAILIGSGSEDLYSLIVQLLGRSRIYGIENPSYEKIRMIYRSQSVRIDPLTMGPHGILDSELRKTHASVLHVTPFSSYPSGITADASKRSAYIQWAILHHGMIVEDDYASEFADHLGYASTLYAMEPKEHVIYINSFTRTIGHGLRISYMILPEEKKEVMKERIGFRSCPVSVFDQLTVAELLENGSFERNLNRIKRQAHR